LDTRGEHFSFIGPLTEAMPVTHGIAIGQPSPSTRISRLLAAIREEPAPGGERLLNARMLLDERIGALLTRLPLIRRLGMRAIVSGWDLPLSHDDTVSGAIVYDIPSPRPLASVPEEILVRPPDEDTVLAFLRGARGIDPAFIECDRCQHGLRRQPAATVLVTGETDTAIGLKVESAGDAFVLVLRPRLPGWRATVDGRPVKTAIGDGAFFAIPVAAGEHDIELTVAYPATLTDPLARLSCDCDPWLR
jgi:hypothetical protein